MLNKYRFITTSGRCGYYKTWNSREASSPEELCKWIHEELFRIYDADTCGDEKNYVRLYDSNNKNLESYYCISYSWYIEYDPEWNLVDYIEIEKVDESEIPEYDRSRLIGDRDWIIL